MPEVDLNVFVMLRPPMPQHTEVDWDVFKVPQPPQTQEKKMSQVEWDVSEMLGEYRRNVPEVTVTLGCLGAAPATYSSSHES